MRSHELPGLRPQRLITGLATALCALLGACVAVPPTSPGYVTNQPSQAGRVLAGAQGGVASALPGNASIAGVMHLEPFVDEDNSIPLDVAVQRPMGDDKARNTRLMARVGYRTRTSEDRLIVGLGAGPNYLQYEPADNGGQRRDHIEPGKSGYGFEAGCEIGYEFRSRYFGVSFAGRPSLTWNQATYAALWVVPEIAGAVFITEHLGINLSAMGGGAAVFITDRQDLGWESHDAGGLGLTFTGQLLFGLVWTEAEAPDIFAVFRDEPSGHR